MALSKTFDFATREADIYDVWEKAGCFVAGAGKRRDETFTVMLPPPNVTGVLHVGHAFNHTLMDILTRWKRMQGYDTLWQPGLDHAGIATQLVVEKDMAEKGETRKRAEMGREAFLARVWEWKKSSGGTIEQQARRLGDSMDWSRSAFTMSGAPGAPEGERDGNFHDAVLKVFVEMYDKGLIYRGKRLVNWDPHFETAISDLEVENAEVDGHMWHFKYPLAGGETYTYVEKDEDGNVTLEEERDYISIATTRPETMLGDGAVAVHVDDERYAPIVGKLCEIPVGPKESRRLIPIITDPYPDPAFGSGAVKITGAHDFNDYEVAKRGGIPMYSLMDTRGRMRADGKPYAEEAATAQAIADAWLIRNGFKDKPEGLYIDTGEPDENSVAAMNLVPEAYRGLDRFEARLRVIEDITAEGLAVMVPPTDPRLGDTAKLTPPEEGGEVRLDQLTPLVEPKKIMQPFGDRSKVVIEPMLTDQWFVDTAKIVGPALEAVKDGRTTIIPESGRKVYDHWLENIEPWCISRQLWWGHQIPVWYGPEIVEQPRTAGGYGFEEGKKFFCASTEAEVIKLAKAHYGEGCEIEFLQRASSAPQRLDHSITRRTEAGETTVTVDRVCLVRDPDVLDTWFSSGLWPFGTLGWPEDTEALDRYFPGDVLITGQDILFFWVARMMMMSLAVMDEVPFHTVYLHQLVRDAKGEKMSKTRGNVIDPLSMVDTYGADALRMSNAAMASIGGVLKISEDRIAGYGKFVNKLWNAAKLAEMNGAFDAPAERPEPTQTVNRWIIAEVGQLQRDVDAALTEYRFNDAANALYAFIWGRFCDWYLEFSKPLLMDGSEADKAETQATLGWALDQCLILLHPVMPFVTEELWQETRARDTMLALTPWPENGDLTDEAASAEINWVISLIEGIRSARAQLNVPAGLKIEVLQIEADEAAKTAQANNLAMIQRMARVEAINEAAEPPKGSLTVATRGATFALPLAGLIDVEAEKARLTKSVAKLDKEIKGLSGRANNPKFAESAPPEVVAETRANLAEREAERSQIQTALARLEELG
ncbi:valine--tRNA ligase [Salipiger sp. IMCC34102]|uniref:valine--tRNA ligase n=1 Tax=Salipiger sp. IMCC34102 TaxID=2510647 RepID=UPI00101BBF8A|nr:valine--tRNA ligase [Salipiger sp. IMCC34102]RYH02243.1 valine--tRNA ligase [Salipiger sp. IMCC34102]